MKKIIDEKTILKMAKNEEIQDYFEKALFYGMMYIQKQLLNS